MKISILIALLCAPILSSAQFHHWDAFQSETEDFPFSYLGEGNATVRTILSADGDTLLITCYRDGIVKWWPEKKGGAWTHFNRERFKLSGFEIQNFVRFQDSLLYFSSENSFRFKNEGYFKLLSRFVFRSRYLEKVDSLLPLFNDALNMGDSMIYLSSDSGLYKFDGDSLWQRLDYDGTKLPLAIDQLIMDSANTLWVSGGLNVYFKNGPGWGQIALNQAPYRLRNTSIKEMKIGPGDSVYVITGKGIAILQTEGGRAIYNEDFKPGLNEVKDIAWDENDKMWVIFEQNGGLMFETDSLWYQLNSVNSNIPDELSCVNRDNNGDMWVGTDNDGIFRYREFVPASIGQLEVKLRFHPNPAESFIVLNGLLSQPYSYELIDLQGKIAQRGIIKGKRLDLSDELEGIYFLWIPGISARPARLIIR